ncbi:hypothetical protein SAMN06265340_10530 [Desulfurobacterium atlanticum]|uniref:UPF0235 protein SAMN06265340_10530 n=2 Tax=Desulfurobacterium atlanticum TaxID=240169 RepID=A0A238YWN3_9BACT|nr:hypothetical protein SAMN06265340_10530 [Desulfurobacterium atlanticum]
MKVQPKAKMNRIVKVENGKLKVKVTAPPENGKANDSVINLLSKELKISKSSFEVIKGLLNREKVILIKSEKIDEVEKKLQNLLKKLT